METAALGNTEKSKADLQTGRYKGGSRMYNMIPFHGRRDLSHGRSGTFLDDAFFRSFFDMNDWMGNVGFRVDIHDASDHYELEAELPGVNEEEISVTVDGDTLTISADLHADRQDDHAYYSERRAGHVSRSFSLDGIAPDNISADYKNGVLYVTLPKAAPAESTSQQRRIPIGKKSEIKS